MLLQCARSTPPGAGLTWLFFFATVTGPTGEGEDFSRKARLWRGTDEGYLFWYVILDVENRLLDCGGDGRVTARFPRSLCLPRNSLISLKYISTNYVSFTCIGKILQDDKTVEFYNIQEKDFLVCLPAKVRKRNTGFPPLSKFAWNDVFLHSPLFILTPLKATQGCLLLRCFFGPLHPCCQSSRCYARCSRSCCSCPRHSFHARRTGHPIPGWRCCHRSNRSCCLW